MKLRLVRYAYTDTETLGKLNVPTDTGVATFHTIERRWIEHNDPGGRPFESCIPDGSYALTPYQRTNGDKVFALVDPQLGVYFRAADRIPDEDGNKVGRYKILIHAGNYVDDVVGCIAPGLSRVIHQNRQMVTSSRAAMQHIRNLLPWEHGHTIEIVPTEGAQQWQTLRESA